MGQNTLSEQQIKENIEADQQIEDLNNNVKKDIAEHRSKCGLRNDHDRNIEDEIVSVARAKVKSIMNELVFLERKRHGKTTR